MKIITSRHEFLWTRWFPERFWRDENRKRFFPCLTRNSALFSGIWAAIELHPNRNMNWTDIVFWRIVTLYKTSKNINFYKFFKNIIHCQWFKKLNYYAIIIICFHALPIRSKVPHDWAARSNRISLCFEWWIGSKGNCRIDQALPCIFALSPLRHGSYAKQLMLLERFFENSN